MFCFYFIFCLFLFYFCFCLFFVCLFTFALVFPLLPVLDLVNSKARCYAYPPAAALRPPLGPPFVFYLAPVCCVLIFSIQTSNKNTKGGQHKSTKVQFKCSFFFVFFNKKAFYYFIKVLFIRNKSESNA